jgi:hypothetical protein
MSRRTTAGILISGLLTLSYGCEEGGTAANATNGSCIANQSEACTCTDGSSSVKVCTAEGSFGACQCNGTANVPPGSGGTGGGEPPGNEAIAGAPGPAGAGGIPGTGGAPAAPPDPNAPPPDPNLPPPDPGVDPNANRDFALLDVNPLSPTFNQVRGLEDVRGKVVVVYFSMFS